MCPSLKESLWPEAFLLARKRRIYYQERGAARNHSDCCFPSGKKCRSKSQEVGYHKALAGDHGILGFAPKYGCKLKWAKEHGFSLWTIGSHLRLWSRILHRQH